MFDSNTPARSNVPEFSVSELAFSLKRTLEENFARVRVRGELSRVSIPASGHMYTTLKDAQSVIDAVCWKGTLSKLSLRPEEGLEVICTGRITTYPARSNYQLIIESMELAGEGALLKLLEERKKKLAAEGLFDAARKRPIPFLPERIGVVTSPTGAVIRDILHRLNDRFPRHVLVWPVMVQGEGADLQVAQAIDGFNAMPEALRPDVLIVARGGGSLEDLMPFNAECVVRACAGSQIPVISAIGHETDTTLIDYAADLRAPTPTGAAEMAVPMRINLMAQVQEDGQRLISAAARMLGERSHKLEALSARLGDPQRVFEMRMQNLDRASDRLEAAFGSYITRLEKAYLSCGARLLHPKALVEAKAQKLHRAGDRLEGVFQQRLARLDNVLARQASSLRPPLHLLRENDVRLTGSAEKMEKALLRIFERRSEGVAKASEKLELLSFKNVLKRGFVVVRDENGRAVTDGKILQNGQDLVLEFAQDVEVKARVTG